MPFLTQPLSREQHEEDCDFTPDSESSRWIASPNIDSVCNKLHIAIRLCYVTHVLCLTTEHSTLPASLHHLQSPGPFQTTWAVGELETRGTAREGEIIELLKETKPNLSGMCLEEDRLERASGKDCTSWCFQVLSPPPLFLECPWGDAVVSAPSQRPGIRVSQALLQFFSLVELTDNSISPGTGTDNPFKTARWVMNISYPEQI